MTEEEEAQHEFDTKVRERVDSLRNAFAPLTHRLAPGDEPAVVFTPVRYEHEL